MMIREGQNDYSEYILRLAKRQAFYVEFWAGYDGCSYQFANNSWGFKLFTGICYGGTINEQAGNRVVECQISDYMKVLEDSQFMNSPFFDGMRDFNAVYTILKMAQFKCVAGEGDPCPPAAFVRLFAEKTKDEIIHSTGLDGRAGLAKPYALPTSYDRLQQPTYKFSDGSKLIDAIYEFAKKAGKAMFFDTYGVFHYENLPYDELLYGSNNEMYKNLPQYALWWFTTATDQAGVVGSEGQTVFDVVTKEATVQDCVNVIHILSTTPNFELVIGHDENPSSFRNSNSEGFIGYRKQFLQMDGIFGRESTVGELMNHYKKFYRPPVAYKFHTYGLPLRCFDLCFLNKQPLIVTNVSTNITAGSDGFKWWMDVDGEWYMGDESAEPPS
jgi:hypothetical protein